MSARPHLQLALAAFASAVAGLADGAKRGGGGGGQELRRSPHRSRGGIRLLESDKYYSPSHRMPHAYLNNRASSLLQLEDVETACTVF
jgi:hypothetical protein